jgi:hypothetical protein
LWIKSGIKVDIHGYQNNHIPDYYIYVVLKHVLKKKPNIHLELSGTWRFFEVFSPTQTGGSLLEIITRLVVDQTGYQG